MTLPASTVLDCEQITVGWGGRQVIANLRRTSRRVLRIEVRPSGDVVVFAPSGECLAAIQDRVKKKCAWVFRETDRIGTRTSATPDRHFVSGELICCSESNIAWRSSKGATLKSVLMEHD